ncbi:MAG: DUF4384 domain-containing protein [Deltaproteobacteria bacterium]|nr:DUF4384 domain-containing protein [Deltaproteobacteria bacterium]
MSVEDPMPATSPPALGCLSDLALDRHVGGDALAAAAAAHLATCRRCQERRQLFVAAQETSAGRVARLVAAAATAGVSPAAARRRRAWWLGATAMAAATVVLVLVLAWPAQRDDGVRFKGASMRFMVQRRTAITPGVSGDRFQVGDALRFVVSVDSPCYLLLLGIAPDGAVSAYYPFAGSKSERLEAGADQALPGSLVLDDSAATEYLVALFSPEPLALETVRAAGRRSFANGPPKDERLLGLPAAVQQRWVTIRRGAAEKD